MNAYWAQFVDEVPWFLADGKNAEIGPARSPGTWRPASPEFSERFPPLDQLLRRAFVTSVAIGESRYQLYSWQHPDGEISGWLCPLPTLKAPTTLYREHRLLLASFGGIVERSGEPVTWILNHNDVLTEEEARHDALFIKEHLRQFEQAGVTIPIDPIQFYSIAREANGNTTLCHRLTGEVALFAPDHAFNNVEPLPGCPDYTLYRLKGAPSFASWVNAVATQWTRGVEEAG